MKTVKTKEELKKMKDSNANNFVVVGELAKELNRASKIKKLSKRAAMTLAVALSTGVAVAPFTSGTSLLGSSALVGATAVTGGITPSIIYAALATGGILFVYALYKDYNVKVVKKSNGEIELHFDKKA